MEDYLSSIPKPRLNHQIIISPTISEDDKIVYESDIDQDYLEDNKNETSDPKSKVLLFSYH